MIRPESNQANSQIERNLASHIFSTSSLMVGLCVTIISVMHSDRSSGMLATIVDDMIAIDALVFLLSCFLSYTALRVRKFERLHLLETIADTVFLIGMLVMAVACVLFVWAII